MFSRRKFIAHSALAAAAQFSILDSQSAGQDEESIPPDLAQDRHRPQFHFLPKAHFVNDPNGPIYWNEHYHLFYQYSPTIKPQSPKQWGHARSKDMLHWEHLPMALEPTPGGPDKDGCWSGSTFINGGVPTIVYTGVSPQTQCLATSDGQMLSWKKSAGNPVIAAPPAGLDVTGFRDPTIWREHDVWLMTVGSGNRGQGGAVLLYESSDLTHWEYLHPLFTAPPTGPYNPGPQEPYDPIRAGDMWECPDFFPLGSKYVLMVSTQGRVHYFLGEYSDRRFRAETHGLVDGSGLYYAAKSFVDRHGRRIVWGWIRESRTAAAQKSAGWSGVISLPRVASIDEKGRLGFDPLPELARLRRQGYQLDLVNAGGMLTNPGRTADSLEINMEVALQGAKQAGVRIRRSPGAEEETVIAYDAADETLVLDTTRSSRSADTFRGIYRASLNLDSGEPLRLKIFLDASVVEVFANGRACLTGRIYPTRPDNLQAGVFVNGGKHRTGRARAYELKAISSDRLTT